jgi:hypothetical protein
MCASEHVLRYLSGTYADGIFYGKNIEHHNKLWGWVDADLSRMVLQRCMKTLG